MTRPKVGLALGGGGARGYAHLGVIRTLQKHEIPIDIIVGTSMGAVIGGAFACSLNLYKLERILKNLDLNKLLGISTNPVKEIAGRTASEYLFKRVNWRNVEPEKTKRLLEFFSTFTANKEFKNLLIQFATIAVDIDTGEEIVLREGPVARAIAASVAIPGIHYPVKYGNRFLVDGGVTNNLPVDVAAALGAEVVIGVDVGAPITSGAKTSIDVLIQAEAIVLKELTRLKIEATQQKLGERLLVLTPAVERIQTLHLNELDLPIKAGEIEAEQKLPRIKELIQAYSNKELSPAAYVQQQ